MLLLQILLETGVGQWWVSLVVVVVVVEVGVEVGVVWKQRLLLLLLLLLRPVLLLLLLRLVLLRQVLWLLLEMLVLVGAWWMRLKAWTEMRVSQECVKDLQSHCGCPSLKGREELRQGSLSLLASCLCHHYCLNLRGYQSCWRSWKTCHPEQQKT